MTKNYLKFDIVTKDGELTIRHCRKCQPLDDPEVKKDLDELMSSFKIKHITSKFCEACKILINK